MSVFPKKEPYLIFSLSDDFSFSSLAEVIFGLGRSARINAHKIVPAAGHFEGHLERTFIMRWKDLAIGDRLLYLVDALESDGQSSVLYIDENRESWLRPVKGIGTKGHYLGYAQQTPFRPAGGQDFTAVLRSDYKGTDYVVCSRHPVKGAIPNGY